jgi:cell division septation protein DedD
MEERKTEQSLRSGRRPGFYMRPKHVGLVFCVSLVGCMVTFGAGFLVGMGYKASEQVSPYAVIRTPGGEPVMQGLISNAAWNDEEITFYDSLTNINKVPMETDQAPKAELPTTAPARTPIPASPLEPAIANGTGPRSAEEGVAADNGIRDPAPVAVPAPVLPEPTVLAQETNPESQTVDGTGTLSLGTEESVIATYSVQVASFLAPERAERLIKELASKGYRAYVHPFEAPGRRLWYRVKVGKFADRATASLTLEKLGNPEAMITRD